MRRTLFISFWLIIFVLITPSLAQAFRVESISGNPSTWQPRTGLIIDGKNLSNEANIVKNNGYTFVPLRIVLEKMGAVVSWQAETRQVVLVKDSKTVCLKPGSRWAEVNGKSQKIDAVPFVRDGAIYVPLRFISETFGYQVLWNATADGVAIFSQPLTAANDEAEMAGRLREFYGIDFVHLPKDVRAIRDAYRNYVHPDSLDAFAGSIYEAIIIPTEYNRVKYVGSQLIAQTADYAVMLCQALDMECEETQYLWFLEGFKKSDGRWLMLR
ncbi:MAG: copper amine oxidase N-terminal domain-containing protein [Peptococcaceae bacterium]|nr:copper amine oxidase N-terminal domain-containing protein [Peptococcaceae bacterium]